MICKGRVALHGLLAWGLVWLADFSFFDRPAGWLTGVFGLALACSYLAAQPPRKGACKGAWMGTACAAAIGGIAVAFWIEPSGLAALLLLGLLGILPLVAQAGWTDEIGEWGRRWMLLGWDQAWRLMHDIRSVTRMRRARKHSAEPAGPFALQRAVLPWGLAGVFMILLTGANPLIEMKLGQFWDGLGLMINPGRVVFWAICFTAVWGYLRGKLKARKGGGGRAGQEGTRGEVGASLIEACVPVGLCLGLFNAVFLVETVLDLVYLWGGAALPEGMTYAEYAHRGAYLLIVTALIAAGFVLATFRPGGAAERDVRARRLVFAWLAQNVLLVASSVWRLHLYVDVYSMTRLRVAAALWMGLVALGLCLIAWRIGRGRSNAWLLRANLGAAFAVMYGACFVDFDGMIARHNVTHSRQYAGTGPELDVGYLALLGPDVLPALRMLPEAVPQDAATTELRAIEERLLGELEARQSDWRRWTLQGWRVQRKLAKGAMLR